MSDVDHGSIRSPASDDSTSAGQSPLSAIAGPLLRKRLRQAVRRITRCARAADLSPDEVHDLRVAIRRSSAALETFGPLLPKRRSKRFRKRLKHVRRAAGDVRDLDVVLERLLTAQLNPAIVDGDEAEDWLERRHRAIRRLRRAARDEINGEVKRRAQAIIHRVRWRGPDGEPAISAAAAALLRPIAEDCREAGTRDLSAAKQLHRFRVQIKRLRYACEFVRPGLNADACRSLQELLAGLQQKLGTICDHLATIRLLNGPDFVHRADIAALVSREQADLTALQARFIASWESGGREQFEQVLLRCLSGEP